MDIFLKYTTASRYVYKGLYCASRPHILKKI